MKNKRTFLLLSLLSISLFFSVNAFSQDTVVRVDLDPIPSAEEVEEGQELTVDIVIENGQNVAGYQVVLLFNPNAFEYTGFQSGDYLPEGMAFEKPRLLDETSAFQRLLFAATAAPNGSDGDGVLVTFTFKILKVEASTFSLIGDNIHTVLSNTEGTLLSPKLVGANVFFETATDMLNEKPNLVVAMFALRYDNKDQPIPDEPITQIDLRDPHFQLQVIVGNLGRATSEKTTLHYYRSANENVSQTDRELYHSDESGNSANSHEIPSLEPWETVTVSLRTKILPTAGKTHYYRAYVEPVRNESHSNDNWSRPVKLYTDGAAGLKISENLISDVAFAENATYFVLNAQFPKLILGSETVRENYIYGVCAITLDIPGVPERPLHPDQTDQTRLTDPGYFMYPLLESLTAQKASAEAEASSEQITETAIEITAQTIGIAAGVAIGAVVGSVLPGAGTAAGAIIGAQVIGSVAGYAIGVAVKYQAEQKFIVNKQVTEILKSTADPILTLHPPERSHIAPAEITHTLFLIPNLRLSWIRITVEQVYTSKDTDAEVVTAQHIVEWNLEETWREENPGLAAPHAQQMSLADYPPFQLLPPQEQTYLLRHFGEFANAEAWQVPVVTSLLPNYPNPFNPETWLPYQLANPADVTLTIYDINGRVVRDLDLGHQRPGVYYNRSRAAYWDGRNRHGEPVASGVYFYTLKAGNFTATRKMLIRK